MNDQKKVPLTQSAYERLKDELADLEGDARTSIIEAIATARAHGDLSENAEYHAAKEQQGMQEARVRQIKEMLENAEIIQSDDDETVKPGKLVTIKLDGDDPETYLLGLREEEGGEFEVLTPESPVGQALLGHSVGETVVATVRDSQIKVEIVQVDST